MQNYKTAMTPIENPITIVEEMMVKGCQPRRGTVGRAADELLGFDPVVPDAECAEEPCTTRGH